MNVCSEKCEIHIALDYACGRHPQTGNNNNNKNVRTSYTHNKTSELNLNENKAHISSQKHMLKTNQQKYGQCEHFEMRVQKLNECRQKNPFLLEIIILFIYMGPAVEARVENICNFHAGIIIIIII